MDDFTTLRDLLGSRDTNSIKRLAEVHLVLDTSRVVVRFSSGALRKVHCTGITPPNLGATVLIQGERLLAKVDTPRKKTLYVT